MNTFTMSDNLTVQIIETIASEREISPTEVDYALQDHIETDAIRLLAQSDTETWTLSFDVPDGRVTVTGTGTVDFDTFGGAEEASRVESTADPSKVD